MGYEVITEETVEKLSSKIESKLKNGGCIPMGPAQQMIAETKFGPVMRFTQTLISLKTKILTSTPGTLDEKISDFSETDTIFDVSITPIDKTMVIATIKYLA